MSLYEEQIILLLFVVCFRRLFLRTDRNALAPPYSLVDGYYGRFMLYGAVQDPSWVRCLFTRVQVPDRKYSHYHSGVFFRLCIQPLHEALCLGLLRTQTKLLRSDMSSIQLLLGAAHDPHRQDMQVS